MINEDNEYKVKLIITNIALLLYMIIILWFFDELFINILLFIGLPIFIIPILYIYMFIKSIRLIKEKERCLISCEVIK